MTTKPKYYIVEASALPEVFLKVAEAKRLLSTGEASTVNEATRMTDISRSAFYKYRDSVLPFQNMMTGRIITFQLLLHDEPGLLSELLHVFAQAKANIITINSIVPTNGTAVAEASRQSGTYTYLNFGSSSTASYQLLSIMVAESVENTSDLPGFAGDFAGNLNNSSVSICYVRKSDTNSSAIGGFAGRISGGSVSYAYTSRPTFALSIESASLTHYHTSISDISTSCPDCDDRFIW